MFSTSVSPGLSLVISVVEFRQAKIAPEIAAIAIKAQVNQTLMRDMKQRYLLDEMN